MTASQLTLLPAARVSKGFLCPFPITKQSTVRIPNRNPRRTGQADDGTSSGGRISRVQDLVLVDLSLSTKRTQKKRTKSPSCLS
ncbi:hypothetical protein PCANC_10470 [Puccinia coronata f. sp. avenae]|uniref:Uncharacterized protein n=1 Tax=Puccinia coronata f. sp. avenae TaxID=200324 RepID=A0A2N5U6Y5_9BASI|nr:hypothetical protein PCASD_19735 [Puccinia coronata f. sp. avenae]PLW33486.1 hypothetical protein PCASD_14406 [Puccinia coronata f. sp. avenae]PLW49729.1 hypothetical protein PCANC_10470 [Puccinia coronata f. sp. avenae]